MSFVRYEMGGNGNGSHRPKSEDKKPPQPDTSNDDAGYKDRPVNTIPPWEWNRQSRRES